MKFSPARFNESKTMSTDTTITAPSATAIAGVGAEGTETADLTLTIFTKNDCTNCTNTEKQFDRNGVPYREINVEEDNEPREEFGGLTPFEHVVSKYGRQMPAVVVDDGAFGDHWTGIRLDKILETTARFREAGLLVTAGS